MKAIIITILSIIVFSSFALADVTISQEEATKVVQKYSPVLITLPGVHTVGYGFCKFQPIPTDIPSLVITVETKEQAIFIDNMVEDIIEKLPVCIKTGAQPTPEDLQ